MSRIWRSDDQIRIPVAIEVHHPGHGKPETPKFRVDVAGEDDLTRVLVDTVRAATEDIDGPLLVGAAVGGSGGQVVEPITVEVSELGQGEAESGSSLSSIPNIPVPEFVLKKTRKTAVTLEWNKLALATFRPRVLQHCSQDIARKTI